MQRRKLSSVELLLNGENRRVNAATVQELIEEYGLTGKLVVVEIDGDIVDKRYWNEKKLEAGMKVELVHFVGGG